MHVWGRKQFTMSCKKVSSPKHSCRNDQGQRKEATQSDKKDFANIGKHNSIQRFCKRTISKGADQTAHRSLMSAYPAKPPFYQSTGKIYLSHLSRKEILFLQGQRRPRSTCAASQTIRALCFRLTESLGIVHKLYQR